MSTKSTGAVLHFFAEGNTARGSVQQYDSSLQSLDHIYVLKGSPGSGKSSLIRAVSERAIAEGYDIWQIHCARDPESLDGVIVPGLHLGVVDGTPPHQIDPALPGVNGTIIDLGAALDIAALQEHRATIERLYDHIQQTIEQAYAGFAEALRVHDDWEALYIENMDFDAANRLTEHWIERLLGGQRSEQPKSRIDRRFLGAATPRGAVDFVPNLTDGLAHRYLIKGRPGSGKSTMLKKLVTAVTDRGFDVEVYHCGFDPNSLDMVIVRELGFAIFDSTKPHEYFPEREGDEIIDMYEKCISPGTDERHADRIDELQSGYQAAMKRSIALLADAHKLHLELEGYYQRAMDWQIVDQLQERLIHDIFERTLSST